MWMTGFMLKVKEDHVCVCVSIHTDPLTECEY